MFGADAYLCLATDQAVWKQLVMLLEPMRYPFTNFEIFKQMMASSTPNDDWFQNAAAAQIRSERFERADSSMAVSP